MAESPEGVAIQTYSALVAALMLQLFTGKRPTKRAMAYPLSLRAQSSRPRIRQGAPSKTSRTVATGETVSLHENPEIQGRQLPKHLTCRTLLGEPFLKISIAYGEWVTQTERGISGVAGSSRMKSES
jgi:hypothetical protein